ncbi:MAG: hypothetical protein CH6_4517 [Candidatus Kapaibacterium sp.]|nr:MAG: hypothetical protein CH6_4517 [Candidatus Kapabacteria bacterium]
MYTNLNEILLEFSPEELARITGDPSGVTIDQNRVQYAIDNAKDVIDSFLRSRYPTPFDVVPSLVNFIARELAIANLYEYYNHNGFLPPTIAKRKSYAMYLLRQIQEGNLQLDNIGNFVRPTVVVNKMPENRLFNDDLLDSFVEL